jgi:hypothetical protein
VRPKLEADAPFGVTLPPVIRITFPDKSGIAFLVIFGGDIWQTSVATLVMSFQE